WAGVNSSGGDHPNAVTATRIETNTFTIRADSTAFGPFTGQTLALFFSDSGLSGYGYEGLDWMSTLQVLGIAYKVTNNVAYGAKGLEMLNYIASLGAAGMVAPESIDSGF